LFLLWTGVEKNNTRAQRVTKKTKKMKIRKSSLGQVWCSKFAGLAGQHIDFSNLEKQQLHIKNKSA